MNCIDDQNMIANQGHGQTKNRTAILCEMAHYVTHRLLDQLSKLQRRAMAANVLDPH